MNSIEAILQSTMKPKEKQTTLVDGVVSGKIGIDEFIDFFFSTSDVNKGTCADVMKHVSEQRSELLEPYIDRLAPFIIYKAPRVKWGIPEAMGHLAKLYPEKTACTLPYLMENVIESKANTTVIRWCAAFAISEIAKHNPSVRKELMPKMEELSERETNNGVRNVYLKALKAIEKSKKTG
jgi:hypothetical protein